MNRRRFLGAIIGSAVAPAIVRASSLMPLVYRPAITGLTTTHYPPGAIVDAVADPLGEYGYVHSSCWMDGKKYSSLYWYFDRHDRLHGEAPPEIVVMAEKRLRVVLPEYRYDAASLASFKNPSPFRSFSVVPRCND